MVFWGHFQGEQPATIIESGGPATALSFLRTDIGVYHLTLDWPRGPVAVLATGPGERFDNGDTLSTTVSAGWSSESTGDRLVIEVIIWVAMPDLYNPGWIVMGQMDTDFSLLVFHDRYQ